MRNTQGYIPRNLGGGTVWDGRIKIRNAIEGAILAMIVYLVTKVFELFLPLLAVLTIRIILVALVLTLGIKGIGGEPLSLWFLNIVNYSRSRTYVTLRPPQAEREDAGDGTPSFKDRIFESQEEGKKKKLFRKKKKGD